MAELFPLILFFLEGCNNMNLKSEIMVKNDVLYDEYLFGIEIETCSNSPFASKTIKDDNNNEIELKYFKKEMDCSIRCNKDSENNYPIEFVSKIFKYKDLAENSDFYNEVKQIVGAGNSCLKRKTKGGNIEWSKEKFVSCGTHIHMSNTKITKKEYPDFDKIITYIWIIDYQNDFINKYYLYQNRYKNPQCKKNTLVNFEQNMYDSKSKFRMLNILPSTENTKYNNEEVWHFEFRGLGEIVGNVEIFKKYIYDLISFWNDSVLIYKKDYKNIMEKITIITENNN
jgi:hypothetical protein